MGHSGPDRTPPTAPLWETTVVEFPTLRARSNTSNSTPLGDDSCGVSSSQSQIEHLQQHPSGRRQLWSFQHSGGWSNTFSSTPLGEDSCGVFSTQEVGQTPPAAPLWDPC